MIGPLTLALVGFCCLSLWLADCLTVFWLIVSLAGWTDGYIWQTFPAFDFCVCLLLVPWYIVYLHCTDLFHLPHDDNEYGAHENIEVKGI